MSREIQTIKELQRLLELEAALERVRARSLVMRHTSELQSIIHTVHQELLKLNLSISGGSFIVINSELDTQIHCWGSGGTADTSDEVTIPRLEKPIYTNLLEGIKKGPGFFTEAYTREEKTEFFAFLVRHKPWSELSAAEKEETLSAPGGYTRSCVVSEHTSIVIVNHFGQAFKAAENHILERFGTVFEQSYTRFLDLQKAEAQAREARIEAALERVRARTMAMQSSEDLSDVLSVLFQQFDRLGIAPLTVWLTLWNPEENTFTYRSTGTSGKRIQGQQVVDIGGMDLWKDLYNKWKSGTSEGVEVLFYSKEDLGQLFSLLEETYSAMPAEERLTPELFPHGGYSVQGHCKFGYIGYTHTREPSEEDKAILTRFATEFGRIYQRYLDIEKAEAQARDAQIETALERVRARSMAMHQTDELNDVLCVLLEQFDFLGINPVLTHLTLFDEANEKFSLRLTTSPTSRILVEQIIDIYAVESWKASYENWKKGIPNTVDCIDYPPEALPAVWEVLSEVMNALPEGHKINPEDFPNGLFTTQGHFKFGYLGFNHSRKATAEEKTLVSRFATEFGRAYQRFLDIQKAEAQAREAQIEAALERVRSRSMGMQNTTEMQQVANETRAQLLSLGLKIDALAMSGVIDNEADYDVWVGGAISEKPLRIPYNNNTSVQRDYNKAIKERPELFTKTYSGKIMKDYFRDLMANNTFNPEIEKFMLECQAFTTTLTFMKNSGMQIVRYTDQPFSDADNNIVIRFGKVFEQAYIRFLDLQKAEDQAREAQIEAALERVRARTMAMQNTEDIGATVAAFFRELVGLGLDASIRCGVGILSQSEHMQLWTASARDASSPVLNSGTLDMSLHPLLQGVKQAWSKGDPSFSYTLEGKDLEQYYQVLSEAPDYAVHFDLKAIPRTVYQNTFVFRDGVLYSFTESPLPDTIRNILERFASVFGQTYTRYLDLKKAEERAREARIELGLERVRARAMAMQDSLELTEVLSVIFQQLKLLGVDTVWTHLTLVHQEENTFTYRMTGRNGERIVAEEKISLDASEHWAHISDAIKSPDTEPDPITRFEVPTEGLEGIWLLFDGIFSKLPKGEQVSPADFPNGLYTTQAYCKFGFLGLNQTREASAEEADILLRFTTEFARLYQRFLDLQNAEERAREARIEAALERVRARSMAMHSTEEILEVVVVLFKQLKALDVNFIQAWISIWHLDEGYLEMWMSPIEGFGDQPIYHQRPTAEFEDTTVKSWLKGDRFSYLSLPGEEIVTGFLVRMDQMLGGDYFERLQEKNRYSRLEFVDANHKYGTVSMSWHEEVAEQDKETLYRFSKVFEQTYTRFLDLQKAEAQAREAQIEAALERVRAKTMAMHNTDDIADTVVTFFEELVGLGLDYTMRVGIGILSQSEEMRYWTASVRGTAETILQRGLIDMTQHPLLTGAKRAWSEQVPLFTYTLEGKAVKEYFKVLNDDPEVPLEFDLDALPETIHHKSHVFGDGLLYTFTETPLPQDITSILERFAAVFGQTYTRYLDLERAEKQARESQIEAALERVRAKALAMHSSADLRQTITTIFEELKNLDVKPLRLGLGLLDPDKPEGEIVTSRIGENDEIIEVSGAFELLGDPILEEVYDHFKKQLDYFPILEGDEINSYYAALTRSVDVEGYGTDTKHYGCFLFFPEGGLYAWAAEPHSEAQIEILKKFSRVVEITYRRYNDLIESEAREKEAIKQASLDRVRAEIASMRTTQDLERITPLVWKELTTLGIPFFRCGVFIMDEASQLVHVYLTNPSGEALAAMDLPFGFDMSLIQEGVAHWRKQESLIEEWDRHQFIEMTKKLMKHGQVKNIQTYQAGEKPPERLVLHQVPFAQGMLYVGSTQPLSDVEMDIVKALTRTFAVAYARYEDFRELEKAKQKVEKTLDELKATQAQLIQSEKMASLGELTAGIAHEIQNPLNFVNNFSEVSRELLEEMTEEIGKGDWEEVKALAGDVIQNLEKINHHGKRADSIVKGMLQHSRSSEGKKEPTDLNALADEYLRLAYHGLRARNKSFTAEFKTDFDPALPRIDAVPQDMGRVLLNLINNAFQAVENGARPTVLVATRRLANAVEISVADNGPGIPEAIKDKIFQPFFTTKPTGQGTGLGLSLSYDIVKAHGGELSVQSSPESGTTFSIRLGL